MTQQLIADGSAVFSECGTYRYLLQRNWGGAPGSLLWVMLNPSTADAEENDQTIRRCIRFSQRWGYGALSVVNLYALISTDPSLLLRHPEPIGVDNDLTIAQQAPQASDVVLAWGADPPHPARVKAVKEILRANRHGSLMCLGKTQDGQPRHPSRLSNSTKLEVFYG